MRRPGLALAFYGACGCAVLAGLGCGDALVPSPFTRSAAEPDAGAPEPGTPDAGAAQIAPLREDPSVVYGAPCVDDAQCDDAIACTLGVCDPELGLCRYTG